MSEMTVSEQKVFKRGVVTGSLLGLAAGLLLALFIAIKPSAFAIFVH